MWIVFELRMMIFLVFWSYLININNRLQLRRGLFWYRNYQNLHQMVKYRSWQALVWTNLRQISLRIFFNSRKLGKITTWSKNTQKCNFSFFVKTNIWEATCLTTKLEKNKSSDIIYSNLISWNIYNHI